nr:10623_t:CDS:2 [Entrophospora candida]
MLQDLIKKRRKTESTSILCFRRSAILMLFLVLTLFFVILLMKLINEKITISSSFSPIESIPPPDIYLSHYGEFNITCMCKLSGEPPENCDSYVTQPIETNHSRRYIGKFVPKEIWLTEAKGQRSNTVYLSINVGNNTTNTTYTVYKMMLMQVFDSEYDPMSDNFFFDKTTTPFIRSRAHMNRYYLSGNAIRQTMTNSILNYLGIPPRYISQKFVESEIRNVTGDPSLITVAITPKYFMVEEEVEQRNSTLISIVGSILGYYSAILQM